VAPILDSLCNGLKRRILFVDNETNEFGTLLGILRRAKQLSQEEVAFECRLSRKTLSNLERNEHFPNIITFGKYAKALNMLPSELLKEIEKQSNYLLLLEENTEDSE
jgi:transcriptional regulator with XRE-family HTH domain